MTVEEAPCFALDQHGDELAYGPVIERRVGFGYGCFGLGRVV
ncbi:hypothetical protein ABZ537_45525 [Streptomyces umbrinus]